MINVSSNLMPCHSTGPKMFCASPKILSYLVPLQKRLCAHKNQIHWIKIIFWCDQNAWDWHKMCSDAVYNGNTDSLKGRRKLPIFGGTTDWDCLFRFLFSFLVYWQTLGSCAQYAEAKCYPKKRYATKLFKFKKFSIK